MYEIGAEDYAGSIEECYNLGKESKKQHISMKYPWFFQTGSTKPAIKVSQEVRSLTKRNDLVDGLFMDDVLMDIPKDKDEAIIDRWFSFMDDITHNMNMKGNCEKIQFLTSSRRYHSLLKKGIFHGCIFNYFPTSLNIH